MFRTWPVLALTGSAVVAPGLLTYQVAVVGDCGTRLYLLPVAGSVIVSDPPLPAIMLLIVALGSGGLNKLAVVVAFGVAAVAVLVVAVCVVLVACAAVSFALVTNAGLTLTFELRAAAVIALISARVVALANKASA